MNRRRIISEVCCNVVAAVLGFGLLACTSAQPPTHSYGIDPVYKVEEYLREVQLDSNQELVDLKTEIPSAILDIRYATDNNFVHQAVYSIPGAFARKPVANALKEAQKKFQKRGYSLVIFDAYRPYSVTVKFYELYKDTTYVASPYHGSRHNRGAAVDIGLMDMSKQLPLEMGTPYDDFTPKAHPSYQLLPEKVKSNRQYLISVMDSCGFDVYHSEWWHFDYRGWEKYPIMDISFEKLDAIR